MIFKLILGLFFLINTVGSFGKYNENSDQNRSMVAEQSEANLGIQGANKEADPQGYIVAKRPEENFAVQGANKEADPKESTINKQSGIQKQVVWSFADVVKKVKDRTVCVLAVQTSSEEEDELAKRFANTPFEEFFKNFLDKDKAKRVHVAGSGFFIKVDQNFAYIVTNNHIVENVTNVKILLSDKTEVPAVVHGTDPRSDLAVLKVDMRKIPENKRSMVQPMEWGDSDKREVGDWVLAIGNPFGLGNTVTHGIISAKSRDLRIGGSSTFSDDFIQHSAQINMGNSGGCLIDIDGRVIGVNTLILTPSHGGNVGIGFAIPSNIAKNVTDQLIKKQKIQRGALGIQVQDFTSEMAESLNLKYKSGAVIASLDPKGPAGKAKLKVGDVIVKFDNTEVTGASKLSRAVGDANVATEHEVTVIRNRQEKKFRVVLGDFDEINHKKKPGDKNNKKVLNILGMSLIDAQEGSNKFLSQNDASDAEISGALVVNVTPDSAAGELGLMGGDIIEEVNQQTIHSAQDFVDAVKDSRKKNQKSIYIRVKRDGTIRFLSLKIDEDENALNAVNENNEDETQPRGNDSSKEEKSQSHSGRASSKKEKNQSDLFEREETDQPSHWFKKFENLMKNFWGKGKVIENDDKRIYR